MGNWMSVQIEGTCDAAEVAALRRAVVYDRNTFEGFHCLCGGGGIAGLPIWAAEVISACGNLAERGYDHDDIAGQLELIAKVAPSLAVKVHCGGDYESDECVATVTLAGGVATVGEPERERIAKPTEDQLEGALLRQLGLGRR